MAVSNVWDPNIDLKKDPKQLTFQVPMNILPLARQVIYMRYLSQATQSFGSDPNFESTWVDELTVNGKIEKTDIPKSESLLHIPPLPPNGFRTKITIKALHSRKQLLKITLHLTTGTVLVQGNKCPEWRNEECRNLIDCISAIHNSPSLTPKSFPLQIPVIAESPTPQARSSSRIRGLPAVLGPAPETPTPTRGLPAVLNLTPESPTPTGGLPAVLDPTPETLTPKSPSNKPTDVVTDAVGKNMSPLTANFGDASTQTVGMYTGERFLSMTEAEASLLDIKVQLKKELQHLFDDKIDVMRDDISSLKTTEEQQNKTIKDHKSQLMEQIKKLKKTVQDQDILILEQSSQIVILRELVNSLHPEMVFHSNDVEVAPTVLSVSKKAIPTPKPTLPNANDSEAAPTSTHSAADDHEANPIPISDLSSHNDPEAEPTSTTTHVPNAPTPTSTHGLKNPSTTSTHGTNATTTSTLVPNALTTTSVQSPMAAADPAVLHRPSAPTTITIAPEGPTANDENHRQTSPRERLSECRVKRETTHILLGDSTAQTLRADLTFPGKVAENLSVSGLSVNDLLHWLSLIPASRQVRVVVIQVGINSCPADTVNRGKWSKTLRSAKKTFPEAMIFASSIIIPKGAHPLKKSAVESNKELGIACIDQGCTFIDSTDVFCTQSGAPRQKLYRDAIHPSPAGVFRLGRLIRDSVDPSACANQLPHHDMRPPPARGHHDHDMRPPPASGHHDHDMRPPPARGHHDHDMSHYPVDNCHGQRKNFNGQY